MTDTAELQATDQSGAVSFAVHVQPRASRHAVLGVRNGALHVALHAPPVDGEANAALIELLAAWLGVAKRAVVITRGERGRSKTVRIEGQSAAHVRARIAALSASSR
jgi:uncharacterized protein (TIGR00251 family)